MMQLRDDNNGLSLIEVMVAIIILAIVVTPFLHSFVTTANANNKAKQVHRATTVAQSVTESLKGDSLLNISKEFNGGWTLTEVSESPATTRYFECDENGVEITEEEQKSCFTEDGGVTYKLRKNADGTYFKDQYYFKIDDLKAEYGTYDVMLKLQGKSDDTASTTSVLNFNDNELTQLPIINEDVDAICIEQSSYLDEALTECGITSAAYNIDCLRREITIDVKETARSTGKDRVAVEVTFKYFNVYDFRKQKEYKVTCYDSDVTGESIRNIYLYYRPLYPNSEIWDKIIFNNNANVPVNLCIFKQEILTPEEGTVDGSLVTMTPTQKNAGMKSTTEANEDSYKMTLELHGSSSWEEFLENTEIYTNLRQNIANPEKEYYPKFKLTYNGSSRDSGGIMR